MRSRISVKRNVSQVARTPGAVRGKSLFRMRIKLAGAAIPLNRGVELLRIEGLEPGAKTRQLAGGKLFDGFLDVFGRGHVGNIASAPVTEKAGPLRVIVRRIGFNPLHQVMGIASLHPYCGLGTINAAGYAFG